MKEQKPKKLTGTARTYTLKTLSILEKLIEEEHRAAHHSFRRPGEKGHPQECLPYVAALARISMTRRRIKEEM